MVTPCRRSFLREAALQGPEAALGTAAGLWRHRPDVLDPQRPQDAGDLAVLLVSRGVAGALGAAEVASSVRVELAEAPVLLQDVKQRRHRGGDALLRKEPAEEDTTVRIVHRHDQVLGRQSLHPVMGRRIEVQEHPRQRPTLALAQIAAAAMALIRETAELQQIPNEGVGHADPMPLDEMLVKMPDGEVRVELAAKSEHLADRRIRDPAAPGQASSAVEEPLLAEDLVLQPQPPHMSSSHP